MMRRYFWISIGGHVGSVLFFIVSNQLSFLFRSEPVDSQVVPVTFVDKIPDFKKAPTERVIHEIPKEPVKEASPPPKPSPAQKTEIKESLEQAPLDVKELTEAPVEAMETSSAPLPTPSPQKKEPIKKEEPVDKPKPQTAPKKKKKVKPAKPEPKSKGMKKKKQEVESIDALLNTLVPDVGGKKKDEISKALEEDTDMPPELSEAAQSFIKEQVEAVWSYNPTEGIDFYLNLTIDASGKVLSVELSSISGQTPQQQAAAEAALRATQKLGQLVLDPKIFKPELFSKWSSIELHFNPE